MNRARVLVYGTAAVILAVTLVSGPAVGFVDLTTPRYDTSGLGEGNATVDRIDAPDSVTLERGYQSESYYLTVPDAKIRLASLSGKPTVAYGVDIPAFGYSRSTTHFLSEGTSGWVELSLQSDTLGSDTVTADAYEGTISIVLRDSSGKTVLYEEPVTVEVVR
ncbi:hypothetical protein [Halosimplex salinum]|uniref:hypothetical protein n=1 Tax=Halosimplex salinum TaxID=1710538 RepID=UPI000F468B9F|nr:hypothetical protein [Halosimplex salinum]